MWEKCGKKYNTNSNIAFSILITLFFSKSSVAVNMRPKLCISMHYFKSYMFKVKSAGKKAGKCYNINSNIAFSILMTLFFSKSSVPVNMRSKSYICSPQLKSYMFKPYDCEKCGKKGKNQGELLLVIYSDYSDNFIFH